MESTDVGGGGSKLYSGQYLVRAKALPAYAGRSLGLRMECVGRGVVLAHSCFVAIPVPRVGLINTMKLGLVLS